MNNTQDGEGEGEEACSVPRACVSSTESQELRADRAFKDLSSPLEAGVPSTPFLPLLTHL